MNIYRQELELKCIESDEAILNLNDKINSQSMKIEELLSLHGSRIEPAQNDSQNRINLLQKDKAIKNLVDVRLFNIYEDYRLWMALLSIMKLRD